MIVASGGLGLGILFGVAALLLLRVKRGQGAAASRTGGGGGGGSGGGGGKQSRLGAHHLSRRFKGLAWVRRRFNPAYLLPGYDPDWRDDDDDDEAVLESIDPRLAEAVSARIEQWAADKDIYEMLNSLESLGLCDDAPHKAADGTGEIDDTGQVDGAPLDRESASVEELTRAYERASTSLGRERVADLPDEKRCVAIELSRVIASAYQAQRIVFEETSRVAQEDEGL